MARAGSAQLIREEAASGGKRPQISRKSRDISLASIVGFRSLNLQNTCDYVFKEKLCVHPCVCTCGGDYQVCISVAFHLTLGDRV